MLLRRLLVVDQRPLLRECDALIEAMAASSPEASAEELDGCVGAVMHRLDDARLSGSPGGEVLAQRIRGQLEFGNTNGARAVIRAHVPAQSPAWPVLLPVLLGGGGLTLALIGPLFLPLSRVARLFLLGLGAGGTVVVVTAAMAVARFRRHFPTAVVASDELVELEQSLDDERFAVASVSFERLRELADEHPDEAELLSVVLLRGAAEVARAPRVDLELAEQSLDAVTMALRSPVASERGLYFATLALGGLAERLAVSRSERADIALALLAQLAERRTEYGWVLASARRRVERARRD